MRNAKSKRQHARRSNFRALIASTASATLLLAAGCASPSSSDETAEGNSEASAPEVINIHVTDDLNYRWGELQIAINPTNTQNIVYASVGTGFTQDCQDNNRDCEIVPAELGLPMKLPQPRGHFEGEDFNVVVPFVSMDGGITWTRAELPHHPVGMPDLDEKGDPSVTVTPDGVFYLTWDAMNWGEPDNALPYAGVGVSKSTDGGLTWHDAHITGTPVDGPKVVADQTTGQVYAASSGPMGPRATGNPDTPQEENVDRWVSMTTDGVNWSKPNGMGGMGGSHTAAHGVLATSFVTSNQPSPFGPMNNDLCGDHPAPCVIFETSTDAAKTWSRHFLPVKATSSRWPTTASDPSTPGHFAVALASASGDAIEVYETRDSGKTWNGPAIVANAPRLPNLHIEMRYSRDGVLGLMWRSKLLDPGEKVEQRAMGGHPDTRYNVWAAISKDGGGVFSEPLMMSTQDSPRPPSGPFANSGDDYSSVAIANGKLYAGWADWREPERAGYLGIVDLSAFKFN